MSADVCSVARYRPTVRAWAASCHRLDPLVVVAVVVVVAATFAGCVCSGSVGGIMFESSTLMHSSIL